MGEFFWLFFLLIALQPVIKQKLLEASRQRMLARIEKARGSRVITLVHRQETMGFLGFPIFRFIDVNDSEQVMRAVSLTDKDLPIDLVLHTPGGLALAAFQIARALKKHPGRVTVFVPHYAMSGGTIIALAADEIVMSDHAVLGPVDPQFGALPGASILKVVQRKPIAEIDDQTLILADQAEKATRQVYDGVVHLLEGRCEPATCQEIARALTEGRWTHDYAITPEDAKALGLPVSTEMPAQVNELMNLFPQPTRRQPSVEYTPVPRRPAPPPPVPAPSE